MQYTGAFLPSQVAGFRNESPLPCSPKASFPLSLSSEIPSPLGKDRGSLAFVPLCSSLTRGGDKKAKRGQGCELAGRSVPGRPPEEERVDLNPMLLHLHPALCLGTSALEIILLTWAQKHGCFRTPVLKVRS